MNWSVWKTQNWCWRRCVGFLVWMSGSLCLIHPPYSIRFCPPHLILFISWVLELLNQFSSYTTRHLMWMESFWVPFRSTWQHQLSTSVLLDGAIFRAGAIHGFCFSLDFVNARLGSESHLNDCFSLFNNDAVIAECWLPDYYRTWKLTCNLLSRSSVSPPSVPLHLLSQVMETKNMLYLVTEYAKNGEIFGEWFCCVPLGSPLNESNKLDLPFLNEECLWQTRKYQSLVKFTLLPH